MESIRPALVTLRNLNIGWEMSRLIPEIELAKNIFNWYKPCLDATFYALDTLHMVDGIYLMFGKKPEERSMEPYKPHRLLSFYDKHTGGFRQTLDPKCDCSLSMVDTVYRIIFDIEGEKVLPKEFEKTYDYILRCQDKDTGAFRDTPDYNPTIASTFPVVHHLTRSSRFPFDTTSAISSEKLMKFILGCKNEDESKFGFANTPYGEPWISSTYRALRILDHLVRSKEVIDNGRGEKIHNFIKSCWIENEGGFSRGPQYKTPTLDQTWYAIHTMGGLVGLGVLKLEDAMKTINPGKIHKFVLSCKSNDGGFGIARGVGTSLYATRQAIKIMGLYVGLLYDESDESSVGKTSPPSPSVCGLTDVLKDVNSFLKRN